MVITCEERWKENPDANDAVWVPNGDQLHYPNVSTCVTVTLIFENGLLGGHASQDDSEGKHQPPQNLQGVISRMIPLAENRALGAFKRICFIGTVDWTDWGLAQATELITKSFGQPGKTDPVQFQASVIDIVFDTAEKRLYYAGHKYVDQTAAKSIEIAKEIDDYVKYLE
jgi:hypothetical protein